MQTGKQGQQNTVRFVIVPWWVVMAAASVVPGMQSAVWLRRQRTRRRRDRNLCMRCGYDLRATPERCPECGTLVTPADAIVGRA